MHSYISDTRYNRLKHRIPRRRRHQLKCISLVWGGRGGYNHKTILSDEKIRQDRILFSFSLALVQSNRDSPTHD